MGSDSIIREISSDVDFEKFFKITEVFLTDEAAVDTVEDVALFLKEQMSNGELDGKILLSTDNNKNTRNGWDCTTPARKDQDSLPGIADVSNEDSGTTSDISQDVSVPSSANLSAKNVGTPIDSISDNGTDTSCAFPCTKGSISLSIKLISGNDVEESMVNDNLHDIGNAFRVTEKAREEILLQEMLEGDVREACQVEQSKGLDEHLQFEVPSCVKSKTGSSNIESDSKGNYLGDIHPYHARQISLSTESNVPDRFTVTCTDNMKMIPWKAVWNSYYQQNYFCNCKERETIWDPHLGLEHLAYFSSRMIDSDASEKERRENPDGYQGSSKSFGKENGINNTSGGDQYVSGIFENVEYKVSKNPWASGCDRLYMGIESVKSNMIHVNGIRNRHNISTKHVFETGALVNQRQMEIMDANPIQANFLKGAEIGSPDYNGQLMNHLHDCFSCKAIAENICRKKLSVSAGSLGTSVSTVDRLQGLPQAFHTHVWIGEEGYIKDECPFQSISTEVHAQEIENYNEPTFGHASTVEVVGIGDVNVHEGCTEEKSLRPQKQSSTDKDAGKPLKKLLLPRMEEGLSIRVIKYWCRRYQLFSKFDKGVKLDEEGWFSVTPEVLAKHHAERSGTGTVIDCFVGVGGNAIQFAQKSHHVIAIDIDPIKIDYAQHNASIYGVADCIDFINGDFFQLAPFLKADVVFLSPPWGGPNYINVEKYDIQNMLKPKDGFLLFKAAQMIAPNIIMFLPRNVDLNQLVELSWLSYPPLALEVEKNYINGELKAITAYYGDMSISSTW